MTERDEMNKELPCLTDCGRAMTAAAPGLHAGPGGWRGCGCAGGQGGDPRSRH